MQGMLPLRPLSRCTDPETSALSERALRYDGTLNRQCWETLRALASWEALAGQHEKEQPDPTSAELAEGDLRLRFQYARRLPDLREVGLVREWNRRTCTVTGRVSITWAMTREGEQALREG